MRIQIIGGSGTGKSTLGKWIGQQEGIPWIDSDHYLWTDHTFTEKRSVAERYALYTPDIENHQQYDVSGSVFSWNSDGFDNRELLVFLRLDEATRMNRLIKREQERYPDFNGSNEFLDWCGTYLTATDPAMIGTLAEHRLQMEQSASPVIQIDAALSTDAMYKQIKSAYQKLYP
ncbi:shikimate kinase [Exiguobacterium antarcticum]|uniref:shikimate kinase n=1 Tax=Exiguobacterium antarcticum TaxID=132920 RepID=UPI00047D297E|nr:shikimate kinase [Exiguobacterium antarcticum]